MDKICTKCNKLFPLEFYHDKGNGRKRNDCIDCVRLYGIKYRFENKETIKIKKSNYGKEKPEITRKSYLKRTYNMTLEDYDNLLKKQNNRCAICNSDHVKNNQHKNLHVDHCHKTGKIRGILCGACNSALGQFEDNIDWLEKAKKYLIG